MFLLSPEADMRPGDLQARFRGNAFWFADGRQDSVYLGDFCRIRAVPHSDSCALVAHGLLRNRKETEVSHSPTVSREMPRHPASLAHRRHTILAHHAFRIARLPGAILGHAPVQEQRGDESRHRTSTPHGLSRLIWCILLSIGFRGSFKDVGGVRLSSG